MVPDTGSSTCNDNSQNRSGDVAGDHLEQRDATGDDRETENCGGVVERVEEKEQELNPPLQVLCVHYPADLYISCIKLYYCCTNSQPLRKLQHLL